MQSFLSHKCFPTWGVKLSSSLNVQLSFPTNPSHKGFLPLNAQLSFLLNGYLSPQILPYMREGFIASS